MGKAPRKIGYMRVSTEDQDLDLQRRALIADGVREDLIYSDKASGAKMSRPGLAKAINQSFKGDILVVWKLDRLGRTLSGLLETVEMLEQSGVGFRSLTEQIDTSSPGGRMVMHMMMAMAEFERNIIAERTKAGMEAKRQREPGWKPGRPHRITAHPKRVEKLRELFQRPEFAFMTGRQICEELNKVGPKKEPVSIQSYGNFKAERWHGILDDLIAKVERNE